MATSQATSAITGTASLSTVQAGDLPCAPSDPDLQSAFDKFSHSVSDKDKPEAYQSLNVLLKKQQYKIDYMNCLSLQSIASSLSHGSLGNSALATAMTALSLANSQDKAE